MPRASNRQCASLCVEGAINQGKAYCSSLPAPCNKFSRGGCDAIREGTTQNRASHAECYSYALNGHCVASSPFRTWMDAYCAQACALRDNGCNLREPPLSTRYPQTAMSPQPPAANPRLAALERKPSNTEAYRISYYRISYYVDLPDLVSSRACLMWACLLCGADSSPVGSVTTWRCPKGHPLSTNGQYCPTVSEPRRSCPAPLDAVLSHAAPLSQHLSHSTSLTAPLLTSAQDSWMRYCTVPCWPGKFEAGGGQQIITGGGAGGVGGTGKTCNADNRCYTVCPYGARRYAA